MKRQQITRLALLPLLLLVAHLNGVSQNVTAEKLQGCWKLKSLEFLQPNEDSLDLIKNTKGAITCFEKNGKFTTKIKTDKGTQTLGTGSFSIGPDGKTMTQKRDADEDSIDEPAAANMVNENEVAFRIEKMVLHYERIK